MIISRKYFSKKNKDDENFIQKNNRHNLAIISGLTTGAAGATTSAKILDNKRKKIINKISNLEKSHIDKVNKKYDNLRNIVDNKSDEIIEEVSKKRVKTGNPFLDILNDFSETNKVLDAKYKLRDDIFNKEREDIEKIRNAANRVKKRVSKKVNKRLAVGTGISTLAGIGVGALVNKKLKERNKRINEEKRNRRKRL